MPLIEIHALPSMPTVDRAGICRRVNEAVATAIPCRLDAVWSVWRSIDGPFVKGEVINAEENAASCSPIVHVYHHRTPDQVERALEAIETVLARELGIDPSEVFVTSQPVEVGLPAT